MRLIPLSKDDVSLGTPLPWPVFDQDSRQLMGVGEILVTEDQLQTLLDCEPFRELAWKEGPNTENTDDQEATQLAALEKELAAQDNTFQFCDMRLKVGDRLQLQPPAQVSQERFIIKLIGYLENSGVLVTTPYHDGLRLPLREGEKVIIRAFSGQNAFGFSSTIEKICKLPFSYLHLSFPATVQGMVVRKSPRVRIKIIALIVNQDREEADKPLSGIISNLSASGALLNARHPLGKPGDHLQVDFRVHLHQVDAYVTTKAIIRAVFSDTPPGNTSPTQIHHGLEFQDLLPNDRMVLQSLIYQHIIENPQNIV